MSGVLGDVTQLALLRMIHLPNKEGIPQGEGRIKGRSMLKRKRRIKGKNNPAIG